MRSPIADPEVEGVRPELVHDRMVAHRTRSRSAQRSPRRSSAVPVVPPALTSRDLRADDGRNLGAEELDRPHHLGVRHRPDPELQQEPVVTEELVLEEDLLRY
jgi:hypothetical protein